MNKQGTDLWVNQNVIEFILWLLYSFNTVFLNTVILLKFVYQLSCISAIYIKVYNGNKITVMKFNKLFFVGGRHNAVLNGCSIKKVEKHCFSKTVVFGFPQDWPISLEVLGYMTCQLGVLSHDPDCKPIRYSFATPTCLVPLYISISYSQAILLDQRLCNWFGVCLSLPVVLSTLGFTLSHYLEIFFG